MKSIQHRLGLGLLLVLLVVGLIVSQASLWLLDLGLRRYLQEDLRAETEMLLIALVRGPGGVQLDETRLSPRYQRPLSGAYFRIDFANAEPEQVWRSRSIWDAELAKPAAPGLQAELVPGPAGQQLLVYRADVRRFGQALSISVAHDQTPLQQATRQARWLIVGISGVALLLVLLLQRLTVRNALRPLESARRQIAQLQRGQRGRLDSQVPVELEPLVAQVNKLLAHTESSLQRSRNALGNLGHGLKTPLAVLVSLSNRSELDACPELREQLRAQLEQIQQRLARELNRARLAGEVLPAAYFDCASDVAALKQTLEMIHPQVRLELSVDPQLRLPWDREDLLEVLGNLLDNACKWAHSRVSLAISETPEGIELLIDDDGPGMAEEDHEASFGRGRRLDEQKPGHGLGLSIVRDTVDIWSGELALQDSPLGGLRVRILLPPRRSAAD
jgi:signal transduction histidine kinase